MFPFDPPENIRKPKVFRGTEKVLQSKSADWILYDRNLHHERVKDAKISKNELLHYFSEIQLALIFPPLHPNSTNVKT